MRCRYWFRAPFVSLAIVGLTVLSTGCRTQVKHISRLATPTKYTEAHAGFTPQQLDWIADNCAFGMPAKMIAFGETKIIPREGFVLEHSSERRIALWVAESVTKAELTGPYNRESLRDHDLGKEPFRPDDELDVDDRAEKSDYAVVSSEYARGHMCPVGNFKNKLDLLADSYVLSNMVPQERKNNSGIWASVEGRCRKWAEKRDPVYLITGGFFYDEAEDVSGTADGLVDFWVTDSANAVYIPTHLFKVALAKDVNDVWHGCAVVLENRAYAGLGIDELKSPQHIKSIDWVEERTGLDFFSDLPDDVENRVEGEVPSTIWTTSGPTG